MGNQQIILTLLAFIVTGLAITLGIKYYESWRVDSERTQIINKATVIADFADAYYLKPKQLGGGGNSYSKFKAPKIPAAPNEGTTTISVAAARVTVRVKGTAMGKNNSQPVDISLQISPNSRVLRIRN